MAANFPPGWVDRNKKGTSPFILVLALVLALLISALIFGCVAWRRKRRASQKDVEKELRKHHVLDDDSELDMELEEKRRSRAQQRRLWVKATARWKPKLSARRRWKRAASTSSVGESSLQASPKIRGTSLGASASTDTFVDESFADATTAATIAQPVPLCRTSASYP